MEPRDTFLAPIEHARIVYPQIVTALEAAGRWFKPATRPKGIRKMANQACFRNAWVLQDRRTGLSYAEGLAEADFCPGTWIHHAWCVTDDGVVVDPTWRHPGLSYFGVRLDAATAAKALWESNDEFGGLLATEVVRRVMRE